MNVWRCWRNTRWMVFIYLSFAVVACWDLYRSSPTNVPFGATHEEAAWRYLTTAAIVLGGLAWVFGSFGIGRDIADNAGAFLLTRPRRRASFIWTEFVVMLLELLMLSALTVGLFSLALHLGWLRFPLMLDPYTHQAVLDSKLVPASTLLVVVSMVLYTVVVYAVTYFFTLLVRRNSGGLIGSAVFFIGYAWLKYEASRCPLPYRVQLPAWLLNPFQTALVYHPAPGLLYSILARVAVILLITCASQFLLEKIEIRA